MTAIASELERQRRVAQSRAWDAAEADLAASVGKHIELEAARLNKVVEEPSAPDDSEPI